jgi:serine/threonine protein kinase
MCIQVLCMVLQSNRLTITNADQIVDVKPDNILVNYGDGPTRFSEVKLGDCGDTYRVDPNADPKEEGHIIGAAIFRSPEAMLNLKWGTPTDIWSFGATVSHWICSRSRRISYALLTLILSS